METVLIVDDEAATRDILVELLHKDGREIVTAGDGNQALDRLTELSRPCLIVLDLMMPRMDGSEFLRRQSTDLSIANIPTIVLSGSTDLPVPGISYLNLSMLTDYWLWLINIADFGVAPAFGEFTLRPIYIRGFQISRLFVAMVAEQPLDLPPPSRQDSRSRGGKAAL